MWSFAHPLEVLCVVHDRERERERERDKRREGGRARDREGEEEEGRKGGRHTHGGREEGWESDIHLSYTCAVTYTCSDIHGSLGE